VLGEPSFKDSLDELLRGWGCVESLMEWSRVRGFKAVGDLYCTATTRVVDWHARTFMGSRVTPCENTWGVIEAKRMDGS